MRLRQLQSGLAPPFHAALTQIDFDPGGLVAEPRRRSIAFLNDKALAHPAVALDLIAKEQLAVAQRLPQYLDDIREETRGQTTVTAAVQHRSTAAVLKQVTRFTADLAGRAPSVTITQHVSQLAERTELLPLLGDSIRELADGMRDSMTSGTLAALSAGMAEALHAVLLSVVDAMGTPDQPNLEVLHHLTADRGELMEGIRRSLLRGAQTLTLEEHQALFTSTRLFERIILLLRQLQRGLVPRV
jgi:phosphate:Na+ symporter